MAARLLFGGSFDPIHFGHLVVCRAIAEQLDIPRTILIPSARPPHKRSRNLAPFADRLEMCRLAVREDPQFEVSDWEIREPGPNYTLHTVQHFRKELPPDTGLFWLIGMDSLIDLPSWYHVDELVAACTLVTARRPGFDPPDLSRFADVMPREAIERLRRHILVAPMMDVSATDIRARLRKGLSVRYLVPEAVREFIAARGLYTGGTGVA